MFKSILSISSAAMALCAATVSMPLNAASYGNECSKSSVEVPCVKKAWDIEADLFYTRTRNALLFALSDFDEDETIAGDFGVSYHFNAGTDFTFTWSTFSNSTNKIADRTTNASLDLSEKYNVLSGEIGQKISINENIDMRFHSGVQLLELKQKANSTAAIGNQTTGPASADITSQAGGLKVGLDSAYKINSKTQLFGNASISFLLGNLKGNIAGFTSIRDQSGQTKYTGLLGMESKMGVEHIIQKQNGDLHLSAGWKTLGFLEPSLIDTAAWGGIFIGGKWVGNM